MAEYIPPRTWWKEAVVYQIYPISFFDSNGDGIGDLNGIYSKLDYLKDLGADVLWLSPIYPSPLADMGYDISDYRSIDPRYGSLDDWDRLLKGVHSRGMKLVMDLVVNHTSDEHEWFKKSRQSKENNSKRDWYIWRPPRYDAAGNRHPPNNWRSIFEGPAWEYDEETEEYYLHLFVVKQPDLNWNNPEVREAVFDLMKFWLDRGCDGFRMDVINLISKVDGLPNAPVVDPSEEFQPASIYFANGPHVHEYIKEMNQTVLSKYDIITVGETPGTSDSSILADYVLPKNKELNMVFQFDIMNLDNIGGEQLVYRQWKLSEMKAVMQKWQTFKREEDFWNAIYIENHDHSRSVSRFGNDSTDELQTVSSKLLALLQISQSGTLYLFQGEELGLKNFPRSWGIEEYKDVATINYWNRMRNGTNEEKLLDNFQKSARDHARVPMQWDDTPQAGFTTGTPWMRVNDDYQTWNLKRELANPESVWAFWKEALRVRRENDVLIYGDFKMLLVDHPKVFAYERRLGSAAVLVLLNFGDADERVDIEPKKGYKLVLGNYHYTENHSADMGVLRAYEGRLYMLG